MDLGISVDKREGFGEGFSSIFYLLMGLQNSGITENILTVKQVNNRLTDKQRNNSEITGQKQTLKNRRITEG